MKVTNSQQAGFVETFSCFFANDVGGLFVGAKPKKHRVAHLTVAGPLGAQCCTDLPGKIGAGRYSKLQLFGRLGFQHTSQLPHEVAE